LYFIVPPVQGYLFPDMQPLVQQPIWLSVNFQS
jgi:hypothetical protein